MKSIFCWMKFVIWREICFCHGLTSYLFARSLKKARFAAVKSVEEVVMAEKWMTLSLSIERQCYCYNRESYIEYPGKESCQNGRGPRDLICQRRSRLQNRELYGYISVVMVGLLTLSQTYINHSEICPFEDIARATCSTIYLEHCNLLNIED